jgi:hypothetical protein
MMRAWQPSSSDEWLLRQLRLCWGDSGGSWSGEGGGMSGYGGGGDWGSAGTYSAAGFNAGGDIGAWAGTAYDASTAAGFMPAGGGGDWGSFGATNYSGFNVSDPNQTQNITLSPFDVGMSQTGGGDWGSSGIYSAAGLNVDPGASNVSSSAYNASLADAFGTSGAYSGYSPYGSIYGGNQGLLGGEYSGSGGGGGRGGGIFTSDSGGGRGGGGGGGGGRSGGGGRGEGRGSVPGDPTGNIGARSASDDRGPEAEPEGTPSISAPVDVDPEGTPSGVGGPASKGAYDAPDALQAEPEAAPPARSETETSQQQQTASRSEGLGVLAQAMANLTQDESQRSSDPDAAFISAANQAVQNTDYNEAANIIASDLRSEQQQAPSYYPTYEGAPYADMGPPTQTQDLYTSITGNPVPAWAQNPPTFQMPFQTTPQWAQNAPAFQMPFQTTPQWAQNAPPISNWATVLTDPKTWSRDPAAQAIISPLLNLLAPAADPLVDAPTAAVDPTSETLTGGVPVAPTVAVDPTSETLTGFAGDIPSALENAIMDAGQLAAQTTDYNTAANIVADALYGSGAQQIDEPGMVFDNPLAPGPGTWGDPGTAGIVGFRGTQSGAAPSWGQQGTAFSAAGIPGAPGTQSGQAITSSVAAAAAQSGAPAEAADAAAGAAAAAAARGGDPADQANAAAAAAQQAGATPEQADAIAGAVYDAAASQGNLAGPDVVGGRAPTQEGGGPQQAQGITLGQMLDAVYGTGGPYVTPGGNVYGPPSTTLADIQHAVYGTGYQPGMPTGQPNAPLTEPAPPSYNPTSPTQPNQPGSQFYGPTTRGGVVDIGRGMPSLVDMITGRTTPPADIPPPTWTAPQQQQTGSTGITIPGREAATVAPGTFPPAVEPAPPGTPPGYYPSVSPGQPGWMPGQQMAGGGGAFPGAPSSEPQVGALPPHEPTPPVAPTDLPPTIPPPFIPMGPFRGTPRREDERPGAGGQEGAKGAYTAPGWQGPTTGDRYLSDVYNRTPTKRDSTGDFTWKDEAAAGRFNMDKLEYAIGGMDKDFKTVLEAMGKAMDKANVPWAIAAGYRDHYRQDIAAGYKASTTGSRHGGQGALGFDPSRGGISRTLPGEGPYTAGQAPGGNVYGRGQAADISDAAGNYTNPAVLNFVDQHGSKFGIDRPMKANDPAHIQANRDSFRDLAAKIRQGFDPMTGNYQTADGKPDPNYARNQEAQDQAQREAVRGGPQQFPSRTQRGEIEDVQAPAREGAQPAPGRRSELPGLQQAGFSPNLNLNPPPEPGEETGRANIKDLQEQERSMEFFLQTLPPDYREEIVPDLEREASLQQPGLLGRIASLLDMFNPVSTAQARGRGPSRDELAAIQLARQGGSMGGQPGRSVVGNNIFTFYGPGASGAKGTEGPMIGSRGNALKTLDDVRNGADVVSLAGHPSQFGQMVFIGNITYTSPIDGKTYTLNNVMGRVDDTGGEFRGGKNPDQNQFDIAVGNFSKGWNDTTAGKFVSGNRVDAVPGRGIGADIVNAPDMAPAVAAQPAAEPPPGLAEGGKAKKGKPYIVGEEGPELFVPDDSGTVVPSAQFYLPQRGAPANRTWPKVPSFDYPGLYEGLGRSMRVLTGNAQDAVYGPGGLLELMQPRAAGKGLGAPPALRINPAAWERFLREQTPSAYIEDRRRYDPSMQPPGSYPY